MSSAYAGKHKHLKPCRELCSSRREVFMKSPAGARALQSSKDLNLALGKQAKASRFPSGPSRGTDAGLLAVSTEVRLQNWAL